MKSFEPRHHHMRHQHQKEQLANLSTPPTSLWKSSNNSRVWSHLNDLNHKYWLLDNPRPTPSSSSSSLWSSTMRSLLENGVDLLQESNNNSSNALMSHYLPERGDLTGSSIIRNAGTGLRETTALIYTGTMSTLTTAANQSAGVKEILPTLTPTMEAFQKFIYSMVIPGMLVFCLVSAIINLLIVLSVRWCRKPMSPTLYFSFSLALADAYASIVLGTGLIVNSLLPAVYKIEFNHCFPLALEAFRLGGVMVTVAHLLALSINYWIGIVRPLQYAATMTRGTALRVIISSWICPIALLLFYFSSFPDEGFQSENCHRIDFLYKQTFRSVVAIFFFTPLIVMTGIYSHIFVIVRNHLQYNLKYQNCQQLRRNVKAIVTTCLILGTYIVGWMPAILWYLLVCEDCVFPIRQIPFEVRIPLNVVINILVILKAFVDPIIYALRMSDIQAALRKMRYEFFVRVFEYCAPLRAPPKPNTEIGSVCFTKSIHLSSRRSSSRSNV